MIPAIVITMAGEGSRFRQAGYKVAKYRIVAKGRSLFAWSMLSLQSFIDAGSPFVFIVQRGDDARAFIENEAASVGIKVAAVVEIDGKTDGQATTVLHARPALAGDETPIAIFNIDTHVRPGVLLAGHVRGAGWAPCFEADGEKWSFARIDADGRVLEMREKKRISPYATLGLYYFESFALFARAYAAAPGLEAGERYIAPLYNHLIAENLAVYVDVVPAADVIALGTPEDVLSFDPSTRPEHYA